MCRRPRSGLAGNAGEGWGLAGCPAGRHIQDREVQASFARKNALVDFTCEDSWFDRKFASELGWRFQTFKMALNLLLGFGGQTIVETGCLRMADDFGSGQSTLLFCEFLDRYGGHLWTIDIDPKNISVCDRLTREFSHARTLICADSVTCLRTPGIDFPKSIDLLYLDSCDFPIVELLQRYNAIGREQQVLDALQASDEAEFIRRDGDLLLPCQQHCLAELLAASTRFHARTIVLIDDSYLPGGGKPRLAKQQLVQWGWTCLYDSQQTIWIQA